MRLSRTLRPVEKGVVFVERSSDRKLSHNKDISVTLVAQDSCPNSCPMKITMEELRKGEVGPCYGNVGNMNNHSYRLNSTGPHDLETLAENEAALIREASGENHLRLHTVGDTKTLSTVLKTSAACKDYISKKGRIVWGYTHVHHIPRWAWKNVSILRSCHTEGQIKRALKAGYAAALLVEKFANGAKRWVKDEITYQPCPNQTAGYKIPGNRKSGPKITCADCRLCWNDQKLWESKTVIVFKEHGNGFLKPGMKQMVDRRVSQIENGE